MNPHADLKVSVKNKKVFSSSKVGYAWTNFVAYTTRQMGYNCAEGDHIAIK